MGRRPRATPPWSSAKLALAECSRLLGEERCTRILNGLQRKVIRPNWQREVVMLASGLRRLGPGLREMQRAVDHSWALTGEPKLASVPEPVRESIEEALAQLEALPVPSPVVFKFFERLEEWLEEGHELIEIARTMKPRAALGDADQRETGAVAHYLVTLDTEEERPITKQIAALLEVANGGEIPSGDVDERATEWEKRLEKWKKALERARASPNVTPP